MPAERIRRSLVLQRMAPTRQTRSWLGAMAIALLMMTACPAASAACMDDTLAALQSARAAAAQGNEQACSAQLAKARAVFQERQP
jgi:hypothetical protein